MIRLIARCIKKILNIISNFSDVIYNRFVLFLASGHYESFPIIFGKLQIQNEGNLKFGHKVVFRSATRFNYVGLYKKSSVRVLPFAELSIQDHAGFSGVSIYCSKRIVIGKHVNCGGNVCIWDTDFHPLDYKERIVHNVSMIQSAPIHIEDNVFIGANSIILKGVTIGERSIVGAGSVVTKNIPSGEIWAGNPAKFIRSIN